MKDVPLGCGSLYEVDQKSKMLGDVGRRLMDMAWDEKDDATANSFSRLGVKCVSVGSPFGTQLSDFTEAEIKLIARVMKKELDIVA